MRDQVGGDDVVLQHEAVAGNGGERDLFGDHHVEAEVVDAGSPVFDRRFEADQAVRRGELPEGAVDHPGGLPAIGVRHRLLGQKRANGRPEILVLRFEDPPAHRQLKRVPASRRTNSPLSSVFSMKL